MVDTNLIIEIAAAAVGSILSMAGYAIWRLSAMKKDLDSAVKHCADVPVLRADLTHLRDEHGRIRNWKHDTANKWLQILVADYGERRRRHSAPDLELTFDDVEDTRKGDRK